MSNLGYHPKMVEEFVNKGKILAKRTNRITDKGADKYHITGSGKFPKVEKTG